MADLKGVRDSVENDTGLTSLAANVVTLLEISIMMECRKGSLRLKRGQLG